MIGLLCNIMEVRKEQCILRYHNETITMRRIQASVVGQYPVCGRIAGAENSALFSFYGRLAHGRTVVRVFDEEIRFLGLKDDSVWALR